MKRVDKKTQKEQETIAYMIAYYCRKQHHTHSLCPTCKALLAYANKRIEVCPLKETKTFCSACKVHCYHQEERDQIRKVMRYSGPRMLLHRPFMALHHLYIEKKEKHL